MAKYTLKGRKAEAFRLTNATRIDWQNWPIWMKYAYFRADGVSFAKIKPYSTLDRNRGKLVLIFRKRKRIINIGNWIVHYRRKIMILENRFATSLISR